MLQTLWLALPELIRMLIVHFADGVVLGWTCGLLLIWLDAGRIGSLLAASDSAWLTALFFVQAGLLFGTLQMSVAVMNLADGG